MSSPQDLILGKVAGVQVVQGSGAPGSGAQIRIRGGSSLNATNDPLIIVDVFRLTTMVPQVCQTLLLRLTRMILKPLRY
jgi:hypothetical protein